MKHPKVVEEYHRPVQDEESLVLERDWTVEEEVKAKRK